MNSFKLIYTSDGSDVKNSSGWPYIFSTEKEANEYAITLSVSEHEINPDNVNKGNQSKFVQFITVEEVDE